MLESGRTCDVYVGMPHAGEIVRGLLRVGCGMRLGENEGRMHVAIDRCRCMFKTMLVLCCGVDVPCPVEV